MPCAPGVASSSLPGRAWSSAQPARSSVEASSPCEEPSALVVAGYECSLATTSLEQLEGVAAAADRAWLGDRAGSLEGTLEAALVRTCCRCELLVVARSASDVERWRSVLPGEPGAWCVRTGREAVRHLFRIAGGLESIARGEREVRLQVRAAAATVWSRHRDRLLRDLLQAAADAADETAPTVPSSRSIAALAATRVLELSGRPFPRVVVLGSGAVGRQVTEHLAPSAKVSLVYRSRPPDERFLRLTGARAVRTDALAAEVALADAVVTAAKSGGRCLGPEDLPRDRPLVLVDLGVPRNVDPAVRGRPGIRLVDLEELGTLPDAPADRAIEASLKERADRAHVHFEIAALEPWIGTLRREAEKLRRRELGVAQGFLGPLTREQQSAVDRLTRRLVDQLLRAPTVRLRSAPPGEEGDRLRRVAVALLTPGP